MSRRKWANDVLHRLHRFFINRQKRNIENIWHACEPLRQVILKRQGSIKSGFAADRYKAIQLWFQIASWQTWKFFHDWRSFSFALLTNQFRQSSSSCTYRTRGIASILWRCRLLR